MPAMSLRCSWGRMQAPMGEWLLFVALVEITREIARWGIDWRLGSYLPFRAA